MQSFEDKVAVITGAGSGIGRSLAQQLNQAGSHLALCDLDHDKLSETLVSLENKSTAVSLHTVDVSDPVKMNQFSDAVITNAPTPFDDLSDELFEKIIAINMWGFITAFERSCLI